MVRSPGLCIGEYPPPLFNRELSWLAFNRRSLYDVANLDQPVLVRLLKLANTSAALDEYFMARPSKAASGRWAMLSKSHLQTAIMPLVARQQAHFASSLRPSLKAIGLECVDHDELNDIQRRRLHRRFEDEIAPLLPPLTTPSTAAVPVFSNLSLNLAVCLQQGEQRYLTWIKVPRSLSRFMLLESPFHPQQWTVTPLEQVIAAHLPSFFAGVQVRGIFSFRVTRSADLGSLDSADMSLLEVVSAGLDQRQQQGQAVRLEVEARMPQRVQQALRDCLKLTPEDTYCLPGWLGLKDLQELVRLPCLASTEALPQPILPAALAPQPKFPITPFVRPVLETAPDIFTVLRTRDVLIHFPYHSFTGTVEQFVAQAATDPAVLTIKMTLYRTAGEAPIVRSLMAAAKAGKQVVVLVELTAFMDEATNIHWARSLEKAGAHVVYGVIGLKIHTNLVLVVRQETGSIRQYAYLGTGDYLPNRPQLYEDLGLLTSCPIIGADLSYLFNFLTGCCRQVSYSALMVAPEGLRACLQQQIEAEIQQANQGQAGHIIAKLNTLSDPEMINALYRASQAGVTVELIVRGVCQLRPGIPGRSDRIRVVSLLGQYVEHSRILCCRNGGQPKLWIGTADWTPRGLDERIEVMVPVRSPELVADLQKRLEYWLMDTQDAWELQLDGRYVRRQPAPGSSPTSAQTQIMAYTAQSGTLLSQ